MTRAISPASAWSAGDRSSSNFPSLHAYRIEDLEAFVASRVRRSTSDEGR